MSMFVTVKATAATDGLSLDDCRTILDELNQEYGMNYMIPSEDIAKATQMDLKEIEKFFGSMSRDEFVDYILSAHSAETIDNLCERFNVSQVEPVLRSGSYLKTQRYYPYNKSSNIYVTTKVYSIGSKTRYLSFDSYGVDKSDYPCYEVSYFKHTFQDDYEIMKCLIKGYECPCKGVYNTYMDVRVICFSANRSTGYLDEYL